jgi:hypothetical protein
MESAAASTINVRSNTKGNRVLENLRL